MATKRYTDEELAERERYGGSAYDQQYFSTDELRNAAAVRAAAESGDTDWQSAHDYVEGIRSGYGYTGGAQGDRYAALPSSTPVKANTFTYEAAPQYASKYADQINELTQQILNRPEFTYDPNSDESYLAYRDQYTRLGQQAMKDTLGQVSARTGGLASSYATTAAEQAYGNYMAALADRIPELKQAAYAMYQDQAATDLANLSMLQALEQGDYARYQDLLNQYNSDRGMSYQQYRDSVADQRYANETAYNRGIDQRNYDYQIGRDAVEDQRYNTEWQYQTDRDAIADQRYDTEWQYQVGQDAQNRAMQNAATAADAGNYAPLAQLLGVDLSTAQKLYDAQAAAAIRQANLSGYPTSPAGTGGIQTPAQEAPAETLKRDDPITYAKILDLAENHLAARGQNAFQNEADVYNFIGHRVPQVAAQYGDKAAEVYRQYILDNAIAPHESSEAGWMPDNFYDLPSNQALTLIAQNVPGSTLQQAFIDDYNANRAGTSGGLSDKQKETVSGYVEEIRKVRKDPSLEYVSDWIAKKGVTDETVIDAIMDELFGD